MALSKSGEVRSERHFDRFHRSATPIPPNRTGGLPTPQQRVKAGLASIGLPQTVVEELLLHPTKLSFWKGSVIFEQGAPADLLYWTYRGFVDINSPQADGRRIIVRLLGHGEIFGHHDFTDRHGRRVQTFEARARTNCEIGAVGRERIFKLLESCDRSELLLLLRNLGSLFGQQVRYWSRFIGLDYKQRLELLLKQFGCRFGAEDAHGVTLIPEFGHEDFADFVGCSRPMVSKLLADLVDEGLLRRQGRRYTLLNSSFWESGSR